MSAWSCPHDLDGVCQRVAGARCEPGMRGCVLQGRFVFADDKMNQPRKPVKAVPTPAAEPAEKPVAPAKPRRRLPF
ncbi:MAG: hypothetical protein IPL03_14400 [Sterolibacteriaceae bacterium]|nr:hypothetical protein [Candidatus Methylophosphatis haderslevensis]